jgi:hypothetical protein
MFLGPYEIAPGTQYQRCPGGPATPWIIEESDDCGMHWRRAELTYCYPHPRAALVEALAIIEDEWRPPARAFEQLKFALEHEAVAHCWDKGIRIVRAAGLPGWRDF